MWKQVDSFMTVDQAGKQVRIYVEQDINTGKPLADSPTRMRLANGDIVLAEGEGVYIVPSTGTRLDSRNIPSSER